MAACSDRARVNAPVGGSGRWRILRQQYLKPQLRNWLHEEGDNTSPGDGTAMSCCRAAMLVDLPRQRRPGDRPIPGGLDHERAHQVLAGSIAPLFPGILQRREGGAQNAAQGDIVAYLHRRGRDAGRGIRFLLPVVSIGGVPVGPIGAILSVVAWWLRNRSRCRGGRCNARSGPSRAGVNGLRNLPRGPAGRAGAAVAAATGHAGPCRPRGPWGQCRWPLREVAPRAATATDPTAWDRLWFPTSACRSRTAHSSATRAG